MMKYSLANRSSYPRSANGSVGVMPKLGTTFGMPMFVWLEMELGNLVWILRFVIDLRERRADSDS